MSVGQSTYEETQNTLASENRNINFPPTRIVKTELFRPQPGRQYSRVNHQTTTNNEIFRFRPHLSSIIKRLALHYGSLSNYHNKYLNRDWHLPQIMETRTCCSRTKKWRRGRRQQLPSHFSSTYTLEGP